MSPIWMKNNALQREGRNTLAASANGIALGVQACCRTLVVIPRHSGENHLALTGPPMREGGVAHPRQMSPVRRRFRARHVVYFPPCP